jgi:hypothetical protein
MCQKEKNMFVLGPSDNKVNDRHGSSSLKDSRFGGNRQVTDNVQKTEDYTKPSTERRSNMTGEADEKMVNPVEEATIDIDDMNDPQARKRETSRRAETSTVGAQNQYRRPGDANDKIHTDADNIPEADVNDDEVIEPDPNKKHGSRLPNMIGEYHDKPADQNIAPDQKPR